MTLKDEIITLLRQSDGLTDREIANVLSGEESLQQPVNQACRQLEKQGVLQRSVIRNLIRNHLVDTKNVPFINREPMLEIEESTYHLSEDKLKGYLKTWLESNGWETHIAWGHERGIDILATKENKKWVIEVKGEGSLQPMRVNYFLGILGETLQRMDDPDAIYSIALPDIKQFRNLWERFPLLAKQRTGISILFVDRLGEIICKH
jgi:hypothetical protein